MSVGVGVSVAVDVLVDVKVEVGVRVGVNVYVGLGVAVGSNFSAAIYSHSSGTYASGRLIKLRQSEIDSSNLPNSSYANARQ